MEPIPEYGQHMTIEAFKECRRCGLFTVYDGIGYYATIDKMSSEGVNLNNIKTNKFTHIVWFNK